MEGSAQDQASGWDEQKCRNFIIRNLEWVPRNFEYADGLRFIHRQLEIAFGDENGHLALGVLEELIELDGIPPFPESMFQRWKHAYKHRRESLESPATPHGTTILLPAVPTRRATEHRLASSHLEHAQKPLPTAPVPSNPPLSDETQIESFWAIPYTSYVSKRGSKPVALSVPSKAEVKKKLNDPCYGSGGRMLSMRYIEPPTSNSASKSSQAVSDCRTQDKTTSRGSIFSAKTTIFKSNGKPTEADRRLILQSICAWLKAAGQHLREVARLISPTSPNGLEGDLSDELDFTQYTKQMFRAEAAEHFNFRKHLEDQHWPSNVEIPNANFARKHSLVPRGESLPKEILNGMRQHTLNEEDMKTLEKLWAEAQSEIDELEIEGEVESTTLRQRFFALYTETYQSPFPTSLFYDTGLDFSWAGNKHARNDSSPSRASACSRSNLADSHEDQRSVGQRWALNISAVSLPIMLVTEEDSNAGGSDDGRSQKEGHGYHTRTVSWYSARSRLSHSRSLQLLSSARVTVTRDVNVSFHSKTPSWEDLVSEKNEKEQAHDINDIYILPSTVYIPSSNRSPRSSNPPSPTASTKEAWRLGRASMDNLRLLFSSSTRKSSERPVMTKATGGQGDRKSDASHSERGRNNPSSKPPHEVRTYVPTGTPSTLISATSSEHHTHLEKSSLSSIETGAPSRRLTRHIGSSQIGSDPSSDMISKAVRTEEDEHFRMVRQLETEEFDSMYHATPPPSPSSSKKHAANVKNDQADPNLARLTRQMEKTTGIDAFSSREGKKAGLPTQTTSTTDGSDVGTHKDTADGVGQNTAPNRRLEVTEKLEAFSVCGDTSSPATFTSYRVDVVSEVSEYRAAATQTTPRITAPAGGSSELSREVAPSNTSNDLASKPPQSASLCRKSTTSPSNKFGDRYQARENISRGRSFGLDGACDDHVENSAGHRLLDAKVDNNKPSHNSNTEDNGYELSSCRTILTTEFEMASNKNSASSFQPENTAPLRIHKQSKQVRIAQNRPQPKTTTSPNKPSTKFPPRDSSLYTSNDLSMSSEIRREKGHARQHSDASGVPSTSTRSSQNRDRYLSDTSLYPPSPVDTARSTVASSKEHYISGSADIIGNFMPVGTQNMAKPFHSSDPTANNATKYNLDALSKVKTAVNPYQFEPDTPLPARHYSHQTTFTDFITDPQELESNPQAFYLKKSPSAGNAIYNERKVTPIVPFASKPGARLYRSESSPNVSQPARFKITHQRSPSPDLISRYDEFGDTADTPIRRRGRSPSPQDRREHVYEDDATPVAFGKPQPYFAEFRSASPLHAPTANEQIRSYLREGRPESPYRAPTVNPYQQEYLRQPRQESPLRAPPRNADDSYRPTSPTSSRHGGRSPTKTLRDVAERDEIEPVTPETPRSPKKRSRSPMKKMFGENGWLGRSPAEAPEAIHQNESPAVKEKKSMMGKIKTKLGEIAEKADLSPLRSRHTNDKPALISVLSVSLGPPEQARILMEVELMLVHTANSFLMNQFSQGRMSVDSIKKTVDNWKARGRPTVIEFMYDQATQRDLVAINQQNFRFHGDRAGDNVRINSMLYTWKLVASQMSIRTFCEADTIILKLLFDIEQILEMLGGPDSLLLRLQQIRATANERMRLARQKKEHDSKQDVPMGRERTWHSTSTDNGPSIRESMDDPYGGMKLVPDSYRE